MPEGFTETFAAGLAGYGERPCIEFDGRWYSGDEITAYAVPVAFAVVDELPRNPALKVSLPEVAALYAPRANR